MEPKELALIAAVFFLLGETKKRKRKKPWLERHRLRHSIVMSLLDSFELRYIFDSDTFHKLLQLVRPCFAQKKSISESVSIEESLVITLYFLLTGNGFQELKNSTLKCPQLLAKIIPDTCSAISSALKCYIKFPSTEEEWKAIAKSFEEKWQFNNCVGCLDARHIIIGKPSVSDSSTFINHQDTYSVICVAAVNANHEFIYVESGFVGGISSTALPQCSKVVEKVLENSLNLPKSHPLPGDKSVPYVFIGDSFWPVDDNIMSPYLGELSDAEKIFNYRLHRANTADNAFNILKTNFCVFDQAINLEFEAVNKIVLASCALHNFLINNTIYFQSEMLNREDVTNGKYVLNDWHSVMETFLPVKKVNRKPVNNGARVRDDLKEYFNTAGRVPFQDKMVNVVPCMEPIPPEHEVWGSMLEKRNDPTVISAL